MSSQTHSERFDQREIEAHEQDYRDFLRILRWSLAAIAAVLIGLAAVTV